MMPFWTHEARAPTSDKRRHNHLAGTLAIYDARDRVARSQHLHDRTTLHPSHPNVAPRTNIPILPTHPHPFQCLPNAASQPSQQAQAHPLPNAAQPQENSSESPKATANPPPPHPLRRNLRAKTMTTMRNLVPSGKMSSAHARPPNL